MKKTVYIPVISALAVILFLIFRPWFTELPLASGDWGYVYSLLSVIPWPPQAWDTHFGGGLGGNDIYLLALNSYFHLSSYVFLEVLNASWQVYERIVWFYPLLITGVVSMYLFARRVLRSRLYALVSSCIYVTNSYVLMIAGGGQVGVAMGYALVPLVLWAGLKIMSGQSPYARHNYSVLLGVIFSVQLTADIRMAYITILLSGILLLFNMKEKHIGYRQILLYALIIPGIITAGVHAFWLLPFFVQGRNPFSELGVAFTDPGMVRFLSFASFEHTLSMLHPNWPENIFGKIRFLQPEFLLIPLAAFASFVSVRRNTGNNRNLILYFGLIGLTGAFLAKGSNDPFGDLYLWLFTHIPAFTMFRDSSKFYMVIAIAYSVMLPYALMYIIESVGALRRIRLRRDLIQLLVVLLFLIGWACVHREAITGMLTGTFRPKSVPQEYLKLAGYLKQDAPGSRVLWIPGPGVYGYRSAETPAVYGERFDLKTPETVQSWITTPEIFMLLARYNISHIVVPQDRRAEMFLTDREFDQNKWDAVVKALGSRKELRELQDFGEIAVFSNPSVFGPVFIPGTDQTIASQRLSETEVNMTIPDHPDASTVIFSESYDPFWEMRIGGNSITPEKTSEGLQAYHIPAEISGNAVLYYRPQQYVGYGLIISYATVIILGGMIGYRLFIWQIKRR